MISSCGGLQSLIQSLKSQGPPTFCLFALARGPRCSALIAQETWQAGFASCQHLLVTRCDIVVREWPDNLDCHQKCVDLVGDKGDRGLHHIREKAGEGEGLTGVALDTESGRRRTGEVRLPLVESQVCPAGQEAEPCQDGSGVGSDDEATQGVEKQEQSREMLDAHPDHALEDCDSMFRNELLESDKEGALNGDTAADLGQAVAKRLELGSESI